MVSAPGGAKSRAAWRTLALVLANRVAAAEPLPEPAWEIDVIGCERNIVRKAILYEFQLGVGYWF